VSFATITLCVASQVFIVVSVYFFNGSAQKLLDIPSYTKNYFHCGMNQVLHMDMAVKTFSYVIYAP